MLQEFDLPRGVTIIGRSLDCHLTIEDPLVSRRHAQIVVTESGAQVEDLGSRNGVKVNGGMIAGAVPLRSGDRLRIGTQELIFSRVEDPDRAHARTTGQLRLCANCRQPYPREMLSCPSCEATEQTDDETLTAATGESHVWTVQLLVEALERAMRLGRVVDAERFLRRATLQVEELVAAGRIVDIEILVALAVQATSPLLAAHDPAWALWGIEVFAHNRKVPPIGAIDNLKEVAARHPGRLTSALKTCVAKLESGSGSAGGADVTDAMAMARMRELCGAEVGVPNASNAPSASSPLAQGHLSGAPLHAAEAKVKDPRARLPGGGREG